MFSQLFSEYHYMLPEYSDSYDIFMLEHNLKPDLCKYGPNLSMIYAVHSTCPAPTGFQHLRLSTFVCFYLSFSVWATMVVFHHNIKSLGSLLCYAAALCIQIAIIQIFPSTFYLYSEGLAW